MLSTFKYSFIFLFISLLITSVEAFELVSGRGDINLFHKDQMKKIDGNSINGAIDINQDTLIMTASNSYARFINDRGDILIIGPNSKVTIELKSTFAGDLIALHDGNIRVIAKKQRKVTKGKFDRIFIRTNSAIAAAETADFLLSYNLFNNVTGLLSFNGESAFKRIDKTHDLSAGQRLIYRRSSKGSQLKYKFHKDTGLIEKLKLANDTLFGDERKNVSTLYRGQYSATFHDARPASMPVKINPIQLTLLYRNTNLDMTLYSDSMDYGQGDDATVAAFPLKGDLLRPAEQVTSYRGQYSTYQKKYAPKAGGLVDIRTGIYIPPENDAIFDESFRVYIPRKIGRINAVNGNFVSPKNLKIDPNKGFVTVNNTHESLKNQQMLNNLLKSNLLLASYQNVSRKKMSMAERYSANIVGVSIVNQGLTHTYNNDEFDFSSRGIELSLILIGNGVIRPFAKFKLLNENFEQLTSSKEVERFYHMNLGLDYLLNENFYLSGQISIDEAPIYLSSTDTITLATINSLIGEVGAKVIRSKRYDIFVFGGAKYNHSNEDDEFDMESGFGFYAGAKAEYWINRRSYFYGDLSYINHSLSIVGNSNDSDIDMSGTILNLGYRYSF